MVESEHDSHTSSSDNEVPHTRSGSFVLQSDDDDHAVLQTSNIAVQGTASIARMNTTAFLRNGLRSNSARRSTYPSNSSSSPPAVNACQTTHSSILPSIPPTASIPHSSANSPDTTNINLDLFQTVTPVLPLGVPNVITPPVPRVARYIALVARKRKRRTPINRKGRRSSKRYIKRTSMLDVGVAITSRCCKEKCMFALNVAQILDARKAFNVLTHYEANVWLQRQMTVFHVPDSSNFKCIIASKPVCINAYCLFHGISESKWYSVRSTFFAGNSDFIHGNFASARPTPQTDKCRDWINKLVHCLSG